MSRSRALFVAFVALGLVATLVGGVVPRALTLPWNGLLLVVLPLTVGAMGSLIVRPRRRLRLQPEVRIPAPEHLPLVAALLAIDLGAVAVGHLLGWSSLSVPDSSWRLLRLAMILFALPVALFVGVHGWEWGLRARLFAPWARRGAPRLAAVASVVAGAALALPGIAPGFRPAAGSYLVAALGIALAREATALRLFRRSGVLLSGAYRGLLLGLEALVLADALSGWSALARYASDQPRFYALRAAAPVLGLVVASLWCRRLDRRDAERRRHP